MLDDAGCSAVEGIGRDPFRVRIATRSRRAEGRPRGRRGDVEERMGRNVELGRDVWMGAERMECRD